MLLATMKPETMQTKTRAEAEGASAGGDMDAPDPRPIVAAVDDSAASRAAIDEAVGIAAELDTSLVFVYVRRGPAGFLGEPVYQRRLSQEMMRARRVLERATSVAAAAGVSATAETLEGSPRRRIAEFARDRAARLVVVGSRQRKLSPSVSRGVVERAGRPVLIARAPLPLALAR
jgi:nucleotide-binding universal stress UspA family protein